MMTMKLLYYDHGQTKKVNTIEECWHVCGKYFLRDIVCPSTCVVTPEDYEPPGFQATAEEDFAFKDETTNIKVGDVLTVSAFKQSKLW